MPPNGRSSRAYAHSQAFSVLPVSRQGCLIGEDPFPLLDLFQHIVGQRLQFEADLAHPLRQQRSVEIDAVTCVDRFLPVERELVGVFGHRDLGKKRFGRARSRSDAAALALEPRRRVRDRRISGGASRSGGTSLRQVQALRHVLADQDLLQPIATRGYPGA
jgi:hypothetical protein